MSSSHTNAYVRLHYWVRKNKGTPMICSECGSTSKPRYEWANISGEYRQETDDWMRLCPSCHRRYDYHNKCKKGNHELTADNVYITPSNGVRCCLLCKKSYRKKQYQLFKLQKDRHD